ncbi:hypothetical protein [Actinophytocola oryzae]|uniref:Uncharacterized protein n=1 Tax=Actinophytocola oryzae TaxID=502181 RepID=A0A4R7VDT4_9PSEU|nr:hypothetical protein [Actinophytocola oryzae]TDV47168.1 hypothetical protein CLV71_110352 [Actinophytocola oryzae]
MSFRQAAARFLADVDYALTRARRAARDARAESAEFRGRTDELTAQAKTGKLRGLRRGEVAPTDSAARADAAKFRADNGLPVPELPTADDLMARLPGREPRPRPPRDDDFANPQVLFDVDKEPRQPPPPPAGSPEADDTGAPARPREDDFSQQRILMDATEGTYRPDDFAESVFDLDDPENRR